MTMGFEDAMKILEEYEQGVPPRTVKEIGCGCEACAVPQAPAHDCCDAHARKRKKKAPRKGGK